MPKKYRRKEKALFKKYVEEWERELYSLKGIADSKGYNAIWNKLKKLDILIREHNRDKEMYSLEEYRDKAKKIDILIEEIEKDIQKHRSKAELILKEEKILEMMALRLEIISKKEYKEKKEPPHIEKERAIFNKYVQLWEKELYSLRESEGESKNYKVIWNTLEEIDRLIKECEKMGKAAKLKSEYGEKEKKIKELITKTERFVKKYKKKAKLILKEDRILEKMAAKVHEINEKFLKKGMFKYLKKYV